jgi:hypothetical protein
MSEWYQLKAQKQENGTEKTIKEIHTFTYEEYIKRHKETAA